MKIKGKVPKNPDSHNYPLRNDLGSRKLSFYIKITMIFLILSIPLGSYIILTKDFYSNRLYYGDADYVPNGNIFVCAGDILEGLNLINRRSHHIQYLPDELRNDMILEINREGEVVWSVRGLDFPHEVIQLPSGELIVADTLNDRVVRINYPNHFITWEWHVDRINWTQVNPEWGPDHYYNNNNGSFDWSHINDIDLHHYEGTGENDPGWDALLISIRNFDLIVELNFTAAITHFESASDIVWYFGDWGNHSMLNHQHNPDYLSNGNIIVADSLNHRIIEINKTTKEIVWKYDGLQWCRDVNELPEDYGIDGDYLISDVDKIFIIDKETKEITWSFSKEILMPYSTEINPETGRILVDCSFLGKIIEIDPVNNRIVWEHGTSLVRQLLFHNSSIIIGLNTELLFVYWRKYKIFRKKKSIGNIAGRKPVKLVIIFAFGLILLLTGIMIFNTSLLREIFYLIVRTNDVG